MKYKCLVLDHDDTVVNSTATIHFPSFIGASAEVLLEIGIRADYIKLPVGYV